MKHHAIYVRVSSKKQEHRSQLPDLQGWAAAQAGEEGVVWYTDKFTGKTMNRPGWDKLDKAMRQGKVAAIVVWRPDRLGRTAKGLTALFDDLRDAVVELFDLGLPGGVVHCREVDFRLLLANGADLRIESIGVGVQLSELRIAQLADFNDRLGRGGSDKALAVIGASQCRK